jgi:hypothetical protein
MRFKLALFMFCFGLGMSGASSFADVPPYDGDGAGGGPATGSVFDACMNRCSGPEFCKWYDFKCKQRNHQYCVKKCGG